MTAYTSTVIARGQLLLGIALTVAAVAAVAILAPFWTIVPVLLACGWALTSLCVVRLAIGPDRTVITQGVAGPPYRIPRTAIVDAAPEYIGRAAAVGIGLGLTRRLLVGSGPALRLTLADGEVFHISTPDPQLAVTVLERSAR